MTENSTTGNGGMVPPTPSAPHPPPPPSASTGTANQVLPQKVKMISIDKIFEDVESIRKTFRKKGIDGLASSIKTAGVLQPVHVEKKRKATYGLIAGHRRLRAAKQAGLTELPAVIVDKASREQRNRLQLIENHQRKPLSPVETAMALVARKEMLDATGKEATWEAVAADTGVSVRRSQQLRRLLDLPSDLQKQVVSGFGAEKGQLTEKHVRSLLRLPSNDARRKLFSRIKKERLSASATAKVVKKIVGPVAKKKRVVIEAATDEELVKKLEAKIKELIPAIGDDQNEGEPGSHNPDGQLTDGGQLEANGDGWTLPPGEPDSAAAVPKRNVKSQIERVRLALADQAWKTVAEISAETERHGGKIKPSNLYPLLKKYSDEFEVDHSEKVSRYRLGAL